MYLYDMHGAIPLFDLCMASKNFTYCNAIGKCVYVRVEFIRNNVCT